MISKCNSTLFPTANAVIVQDGYKNGDIHLVHVAVYPFIYNSELKQLTFAESIEVTLADAKGGQFKSKAANTYTSTLRPLKKLNLSSYIKVNSLDMQSMSTPTVGNGLPVYEYAVITSKRLAPAFDKIIGLKKQKGLDAGVVCIEDIKSDPAFSKGDTISNINDEPGKLRAYLMACRQSRGGDMYVLLGGSLDIIPVRYAYEDSDYTNDYKIIYCPNTTKLTTLHPYANFLPTDWYYTDLNGNWNKNQNKDFGEDDEKSYIDFNPDIYVGRICCKNKEEVDNYTYKLIKYEMNPGNGDFSYLRNLLSIQADQMQNFQQSENAWKECQKYFDYHKSFQEMPSHYSLNTTSPSGSEIINELNTTNYGFFNIHCHGGIFGSAVRTKEYDSWEGNAIVSMKDIINNYRTWAKEDGNSIDRLTNYDYPMIGYSMGCDLIPYDNMLLHVRERKNKNDDIKLPSNYYNFGDSFTIGGTYGGPAFISNTRYGIVGPSFNQEKIFLQLLGMNWSLGCIRAATQTLYNENYHCRLTNNLLGCPEFKMWINTPQIINYTLSSDTSSASNTITCNKGINAYCIDIANGQVYELTENESNDNRTFSYKQHNVVTTLIGRSCIPSIMDLSLNDVTIMSNGYYFVNNIVSPKSQTASSTIKITDAHITFDVSGSIDVHQPIVIDNGADVTFVAKGNATFDDIIIKNGSRLIIESNGYSLEGECSCEIGCEFVIK